MLFPLISGCRSLSIDTRVRQTLPGYPFEPPSTLITWENWDDAMMKFVANCMVERNKLLLGSSGIIQNIAEKKNYENKQQNLW